MKRNAAACLIAVLLVGIVCAGCKAEDDITPAPTAKPDQASVVVNNEQLPQEHVIEVCGYGEVIAKPDFSTITIGVQGKSETAEEATQLCETAAQSVCDLATGQGALTKNITTAGVTLSTTQRESDGMITGYVAADTITVVVNDVEKVNAILSAIIDAGITESYEVTYSLSDASSAYQEALSAAMAAAQEKAAAIAVAGGVTLGAVVEVTETPSDAPLVGVAFESSAIAVSAEVTVRYLIS